uniref:Uncharacterized protein n=1 Tax=Meloidogyne enterolobii TaxID=390850 RepID=A0A6V7U508_MELEN|nr:unnamed protein product [Meloidogyne enterolobii]
MIFPKIYFSFLFLFCLIYLIKSQESIPQKFFGAFQYENSDNWEAYLAAKGYNEEMRRTVKPPKLTRVLFPTGPGYRMMIGQGLQGSKWLPGAKKNADWTFQLGKEFRAKYWDGREHLILFTYNPSTDRLIERHVVLGAQVPPEDFLYEINQQGNMDLHVLFQNVHLIHHYIRTD